MTQYLRGISRRAATILLVLVVAVFLVLVLTSLRKGSRQQDSRTVTQDRPSTQPAGIVKWAESQASQNRVQSQPDTPAAGAAGQALESLAGNTVSDGDPVLGAFAAAEARQLPDYPIRLANRKLAMDPSSFGRSPDPAIQELLEKYNASRACIAKLTLKGKCHWVYPNRHDTADQEWTFNRQGLSKQKCGTSVRTMSNGIAMVVRQAGDDFLDSFFLMPMAVFDPAMFDQAQDKTIGVVDGLARRTEEVAATELRSPECALYFGRKDGQLRKVALTTRGESKPYVEVDMLDHVDVEGIRLPLTVQVTFPDNTHFTTGKGTPAFIALEVQADSISITEDAGARLRH